MLDLSKRNKLLYFRRTRSSTLQVVGPETHEVFTLLALSTKDRPLYEPAQVRVGEVKEGGAAQAEEVVKEVREVEDEAEGPKAPEREARPPKEGELVTDVGEPQHLRNILTNLYRRARSDYEERGIRVLHATFGLLHWRETPESEESLAPLVLLPLDIVRQSFRSGFTLRNCEEDAVLNPCLEAKLENDFRVKLPGLPDDWEGFDINAYLDQVASCVRGLGWSVSGDVMVGLFSFHKLAMYKDLELNLDRVGGRATPAPARIARQRHPLLGAFAQRQAVLAP